MSYKYQLFRISLVENTQPLWFSEKGTVREEIIINIFSKKIDFTHRGKEYSYVFIEKHNDMLIGMIGKEYQASENRPPEEKFSPVLHQGWLASPIIIDPTEHQDGQKISMNDNQDVGTPNAILNSLNNHINDMVIRDTNYHSQISPIFNDSEFWEFYNQNKHSIKCIDFEFTTPNMFGTTDAISEELRKYRDEEKAQKVEIKITSDDNLNLETDRVRNSVEYTSKGAGRIKAKSQDGSTFDSDNHKEMTHIPKDQDDDKELIDIVKKYIYIILGHE